MLFIGFRFFVRWLINLRGLSKAKAILIEEQWYFFVVNYFFILTSFERRSLSGDERVHHIISECSKLAKNEYKTWHDRVGKVIYWELCKRLKFDHTIKYYMSKPEPVL